MPLRARGLAREERWSPSPLRVKGQELETTGSELVVKQQKCPLELEGGLRLGASGLDEADARELEVASTAHTTLHTSSHTSHTTPLWSLPGAPGPPSAAAAPSWPVPPSPLSVTEGCSLGMLSPPPPPFASPALSPSSAVTLAQDLQVGVMEGQTSSYWQGQAREIQLEQGLGHPGPEGPGLPVEIRTWDAPLTVTLSPEHRDALLTSSRLELLDGPRDLKVRRELDEHWPAVGHPC